MKTSFIAKLFLSLLISAMILICLGCTAEEQPTINPKENRTDLIVDPVYSQHGFIERINSVYWAKISWYTTYDFPTFQPHYCTVYRNGIVVLDFVNEPNNISQIRLAKRTNQATFTITQTVIGLGTSAPVELTVYYPQGQKTKKQ